MNFELIRVETEELQQYKADMQAAFQKGFEDVFGKTDSVILPETDIDQSLNAEGAVAYKAVVDGKMVGGAVVVIAKALSTIILICCLLRTVFRVRESAKRSGLSWRRCTPVRRCGKPVHLTLTDAIFIFM